jgi:hypothetical protein
MFTPIPVNNDALPDGALGGMFAGMNAANANDQNTQALASMFLQNQKDASMLPMDLQIKQAQIAPAQYQSALATAKQNSPDYIQNQLAGETGQMQTQQAAGAKAMALAPFVQAAEKGNLENTAASNEQMAWFQAANKALQDGGGFDDNGVLHPFSPRERQALEAKRDSLLKTLSSTPEQNQKMQLNDAKIQGMLAEIQLRHEGEMEKTRQQGLDRINLMQSKYDKIMSLPPNSPAAAAVRELYTHRDNYTDEEFNNKVSDILAAASKADTNATGTSLHSNPDGTYSLDNAPPKNNKVNLNPGGQQAIAPGDQEALNWLQSNPNDPHAAAVRAKLQVKGIIK